MNAPDRTFQAWCDLCGKTRTVRGSASRTTYGVPGHDGVYTSARCLKHRNPDKYLKITSDESRALLRNPDWLRAAYADHTTREIAARIGTNQGLVSHWMKRHGIPGRTREEALARFYATKRSSRNIRNRQMVTAGIADGGRITSPQTSMPNRGAHTGA